MIKLQRWQILALCMALGGGSLSAIAQLDIPTLFKGYALLVPLQGAALLYVFYWYRRRSLPIDRGR